MSGITQPFVRWLMLVGIFLTVWFGLASGRAWSRNTSGESLRWFGQVEFHGSILNGIGDRQITGTTFGPAIKVGHRWRDWGIFFSIEQNLWVNDETGSTDTHAGALNIGVGTELIYASRWLRASFALGPSILLYETGLDPVGTTGFYLDLRPTGIRFPIKDWFVLMVDPISFALVAPVLTGIPLVLIEYRTTLTTEFRW